MQDAPLFSDPAAFEILKNSLYKIAEEMRVVLAKTAYSPLLKSAGDYSCGVFDARGEMVAQGPDLPIHLGSMPDAVRAVVAAFGSDVHDGDVFIHNDPYFGGSHLPDVNVVRPAFYKGVLLGYACLRAHWPDVGSATPGSYGAVTDIYGEGLRLPPLRLISRGTLNVDLEKVILANVRTPDERKGDLGAQLAATLRATERLKGLAERYGRRAARRHHGRGDELFRAADAGDAVRPAGRRGIFRGLLRRRRHPRHPRRQGCAVLDPHARDQDRRPRGGRFRRQRPAGQRPDQCAAVGLGLGRLLRAQDGGRSQQSHSAQLRMLAHHRGQGAQGLGGECGVSRAGGLRQPRDFASRRRHGDGRAGQFLAEPGDGLQPGHLGDPDARRARPALAPALRLLRDHQGRLRRATQQGRHPRRRQRHLQHHEHADRSAGDGVSRAHGALRDQSRLRRRRAVSRRLRRAPRVAHAGRRGRDRRAVHGAHDLAAVRPARRQGRSAGRGYTRRRPTAPRATCRARARSTHRPARSSTWWCRAPAASARSRSAIPPPSAATCSKATSASARQENDYGVADPEALRAAAAAEDQA